MLRDLQQHDDDDHNMYVNCLHPDSFIKTDMTGQGGYMSVAEATAYVARDALFPPGRPLGQFFDKYFFFTSF